MTLSKKQSEFIEEIKKGSNVFLTGKAGTGKSFVVKKAIETLKEYVFDETNQCLELKDIGSIEQVPIKLAYALSIHKSQGLTFDEVTLDLTRPCFQKGQMYVALSRVTSPEGLRIII